VRRKPRFSDRTYFGNQDAARAAKLMARITASILPRTSVCRCAPNVVKPKEIQVVPQFQTFPRAPSATNVGEGKDSEARQRKAIEGFAKSAGYVIVHWFYDAAVSGADPIETRPGFAAALARISGNGVRTIIVETANRFARDLIGSRGWVRYASIDTHWGEQLRGGQKRSSSDTISPAQRFWPWGLPSSDSSCFVIASL
jgi:Resolvase, N terminal domain